MHARALVASVLSRCQYGRRAITPSYRFYNSTQISPQVEAELAVYSKKKQTSVSLKALMDAGLGEISNIPTGKATKASEKTLLQIACFLHREMPVRLAHRATQLEGSSLFQQSGKNFEQYAVY